jgi:hypothetical protein
MSKKDVLGTLSPAYGLMSGEGAFGKLAPAAGLLPMALADRRRNKREEEAARLAAAGSPGIASPTIESPTVGVGMKNGGSVKSSASRRADGIASRGKTKGKFV